MRLIIIAAVALLAAPAGAIFPSKADLEQARRFGLNAPGELGSTLPGPLKQSVLAAYNGHRLGGLGPAALGPSATTASAPRAAAAFLADSLPQLGIDPKQLELVTQSSGLGGLRHVLYRQVYKGLPVEFSRIKVHLDASGRVLDLDSNYRPDLNLDVQPRVSAAMAAEAVRADVGQEPRSAGQLVVLLVPKSGQARLAWKFTVTAGGRWRAYVDADTGKMLLRYDALRYACAGGSAEGHIRIPAFPIDSGHGSGGVPSLLSAAHERVYLDSGNTWTDTDSNGFYCFDGKPGKVFTQLQGPFVRVANFRGASAHYDNGSGLWSLTNTPISSPHPYPNNADLVETVTLPAGLNAAEVLPIFKSFNVGAIASDGVEGEGADITDDDQVSILDSSGVSVAAYVGNRGAFNAAAVPGPSYSIRLRSNASGQENGYEVAVSSYLVLSNPGVNGSAPPESEDGLNGSFDWLPGSYTATGLRAEGALFYQLNLMHDYFSNDVDRAGNAALTPVTAMALVGPSLVNAFYDPDYDDLAFGDVSNDSPSEAFTDDATVIHHEYTHYMVQKIWNIQNFGEAGAISEAIADYFSASSLNDPDIGQGAVQALGGSGPLRELDCQAHPSCMVLGDGTNGTTAWQGEIHLDSLYVSQALWDLRRDRIAAQGQNAGSSCVDNLVFQSLLFFPESFSELINAMETVDKTGAAPACGGPIGAAEIAGKFAAHGLPLGAGGSDPYDTSTSHNDGFETAADIAGLSSVSATIDPASDIDFFTLPAGQGQVELELDLPREGAYYSGYQMSVYDRNHSLIGTAAPPFDGFNTDAGFCTQSDCTTTDSKVSFSFDNPSAGQIFIEISGGPTDAGGSNSRVHNSTPYTLRVSYPRSGAIDAGIVSAKVDNDLIHFSVDVTTWTRNQDYRFAYAQLRDQALEMLPNTTAPPQGGGTQFLTFISSENALGKVSGTVALAPGFNARFPAVGTVSLEVFGYNVAGSTVSLGVSEPMNLSTNASEVKAWNNVFDPERGEKTTIRYDVSGSGRLTMRLYTLTGTHIVTLFDADVSPGKGSVDWTGQNLAGNFVASGIYLLRVDGPGLSKTLKIAVIK